MADGKLDKHGARTFRAQLVQQSLAAPCHADDVSLGAQQLGQLLPDAGTRTDFDRLRHESVLIAGAWECFP